jgi:hypothetical protein
MHIRTSLEQISDQVFAPVHRCTILVKLHHCDGIHSTFTLHVLSYHLPHNQVTIHVDLLVINRCNVCSSSFEMGNLFVM